MIYYEHKISKKVHIRNFPSYYDEWTCCSRFLGPPKRTSCLYDFNIVGKKEWKKNPCKICKKSYIRVAVMTLDNKGCSFGNHF